MPDELMAASCQKMKYLVNFAFLFLRRVYP